MWILALLFATAVTSQTPSPMQPLDFLVGEWDGNGWIMMGPQGKVTFTQHESVRSAAGGTVIVIDGLGTRDGKSVHEAFAVVSFDAAAKQFSWRAWRKGGEEIAVTPQISDRKLVWGFKDPRAGDIRFTIELTDAGEWHETGMASRDGGPQMQFFEMTLKKR